MSDTLKELLRRNDVLVGFTIILFFATIAVFADYISPYGYRETMFNEKPFLEPSMEHFLGTDQWGDDLFAHLIYGTRTVLFVALTSAVISTFIGIIAGLLAGFYGGVIDEVISRTIDILLIIPIIPLQIILAYYLGPSIWNIILVIVLFGWITVARVVRSQVLSIKNYPYIEAARSLGASNARIMFKHILPGVSSLGLAYVVLNISNAIYTEAALSFIGLGDPIAPSWGKMLNYAYTYGAFTKGLWAWIIVPGLFIMLLSIATIMVGNAIIDIYTRRQRMV